jgi:hypothetical protein
MAGHKKTAPAEGESGEAVCEKVGDGSAKKAAQITDHLARRKM